MKTHGAPMKLLKWTTLSLLAFSFTLASALAATPVKAKGKNGPVALSKVEIPQPSPTPKAAETVAPAPLKRLDPHGTIDMDFTPQNQCQACHIIKKDGGFDKKANIETLCFGCHGRLPHSGVLEHMGDGKGNEGAGLNCLSCHRPHRGKMDGNAPTALPRSKIVKVTRQNLSAGLVDSPSTSSAGAMLDHPCTECHAW